MKRILLVDDREDDILLARRVIGKIDDTCEITVARDGEEALRMLDSVTPAHFHVLLLDIQLPGIDGLTVLRRIRSDALRADQAIVILTTSSGAEDKAEAHRLAANMYIVKPMDIRDFESEMRNVLMRF